MIKVDLITGFLGSGKTTFLKKYASHFISKGMHIGILENDYGAVNVDMLLLNELRGKNCELEMVAGGCDIDCHKRRFKTKLIAMAMSGYDRVIIEPSGIFDVDEFFDTIRDETLERFYEIGNVIAIVDAKSDAINSETSNYFLASQIANAGLIIISKAQLVDDAHLKEAINHLKKAAADNGLKIYIDNMLFTKDWNKLNNNDYDYIASQGYAYRSYIKKISTDESGYKTLYFLEMPIKKEGLEEKINKLMSNPIYGTILRCKGFFNESDIWYQFNATKDDFSLEEISVGQQIFIVIGENPGEEKIRKLMLP